MEHRQTETAEVTLVLERGPESLRGSAADRTGSRRRFTGWLGLLSVLEDFLDGKRESAADETTEAAESGP